MGLPVFLRLVLVGFVILDLIGDASGQRYCSQRVRNRCGRNRTPSACYNYQCGRTYTDNRFRNFMVDRHNYYRRSPCLGSYGGNMIRMRYNVELEDVSYRWLTNLCRQGRYYHDEPDCRCSPRYDSVGQNLWTGSGQRYSDPFNAGAEAIGFWYSQRIDVTYREQVFPYRPTRDICYGEYSQMMWAESYEVGCAYLETRDRYYGNRVYIACNYASSGNRIDHNMFYPSPDIGSNCISGSRRDNSGLCEVVNEDLYRRSIGLNYTG